MWTAASLARRSLGVVAPMTDACVAGDPYMSPVSQLDRLTRVTSHELGEMISDPDFPSGWFSSTSDEIGDICETTFGSFQVTHGRDDQYVGGSDSIQPVSR